MINKISEHVSKYNSFLSKRFNLDINEVETAWVTFFGTKPRSYNPRTYNKQKIDWIPWSEKSQDIPFKSTTIGVGDGERKVAREMDTNILGQNSPYDIEIFSEGVSMRYDVKNLDVNNDFNTGKHGRDALRPVKYLHIQLLLFINELSSSNDDVDVFTTEERLLLHKVKNVSPDELSEGTLCNICNACEMLNSKKKKLRSSLLVTRCTVFSNTIDIPVDIYYVICNKLNLPFPLEYSSYVGTIRILRKMDHIYIENPKMLMNDLYRLVEQIFSEIKVIIVDEHCGYKIINDTCKIKFYRITRGHPRFKVLF